MSQQYISTFSRSVHEKPRADILPFRSQANLIYEIIIAQLFLL